MLALEPVSSGSGRTTNPSGRTQNTRPPITKTQQIEMAVAEGCVVLRDIANRTNITYRSVNAIVASLESRGRLATDDFELRRGERRFYIPAKSAECASKRPAAPVTLQQVWMAVVAVSPVAAQAGDAAAFILRPLLLIATAVI